MAPRFESSTVLPLFPTLVWQARLSAAHRDAIAHAVLPQLDVRCGGFEKLPSGRSWQSDPGLHEDAAFAELMGCVTALVDRVLAFLKVGHRECRLTGCWANVNPPGTAHAVHAHPNNFLSGVYYLRVPQQADTICFHDPRIQAAVVRPPVTELTGENADQVVVRVRDGTLLMFPSWLHHSVNANASTELRISVSFNLMFDAFAETVSPPMWSGR
jgi:uncharacterized protein (TIGR02466 family)